MERVQVETTDLAFHFLIGKLLDAVLLHLKVQHISTMLGKGYLASLVGRRHSDEAIRPRIQQNATLRQWANQTDFSLGNLQDAIIRQVSDIESSRIRFKSWKNNLFETAKGLLVFFLFVSSGHALITVLISSGGSHSQHTRFANKRLYQVGIIQIGVRLSQRPHVGNTRNFNIGIFIHSNAVANETQGAHFRRPAARYHLRLLDLRGGGRLAGPSFYHSRHARGIGRSCRNEIKVQNGPQVGVFF
mmetsp:Transcript_1076/g.2090  ORF Transcript_1076/g.2090 Transcript_1076/m.2090 type:complete len:245 (-) Transcript_1076:604-1338(-)